MLKFAFQFLCFLPFFATAQDYRVEFFIHGLPDQKVVLSSFKHDQYIPIDSIKALNGTYYFVFDTYQEPGMYRASMPSQGSIEGSKRVSYIEFIWNSESFTVSASYDNLSGSVEFSNSVENNLLGEFRQYESLYERKLQVLFSVLDHYPEQDKYYEQTAYQIKRIQYARDSFITSMSDAASGLYVSRLVMAYRRPAIPTILNGPQRKNFLKEHFFEHSMIDDPGLLRAPVYNRQIIDYLMLYREREFTFAEQQEAFITAVDIIMANVSGDPDLRSFAVEYMLEGFESFGMEKLQTYIVDTYFDETCATDAIKLAKHRVEAYKKMAIGQKASDILIRTSADEMIRLSEIDTDYTLVLFWSTTCPHCVKMIPDIKQWYDSDRPENLEVLAISIDTLANNWYQFLDHTPLPWINAHEPMGWEGKSAEEYNIYATPTMFLLDRKRKIIARPFNVRELRKEIRRL